MLGRYRKMARNSTNNNNENTAVSKPEPKKYQKPDNSLLIRSTSVMNKIDSRIFVCCKSDQSLKLDQNLTSALSCASSLLSTSLKELQLDLDPFNDQSLFRLVRDIEFSDKDTEKGVISDAKVALRTKLV